MIQLELEEGREAKADLRLLKEVLKTYLITNNPTARAILVAAVSEMPRNWQEEAEKWIN
jgi:hypothetical protein